MLDGEPRHDLAECDPDRYADWADLDFCLAKCRETYGLNNAVGYPQEDRRAGRPTKRVTPIHQHLVSKGAFMAFSAGWENPAWYSPDHGVDAEYRPSFRRTNWHEAVVREHETVTEAVGIKDISTFAKFRVKSGRKTSEERNLEVLIFSCGAKPQAHRLIHELLLLLLLII